MPSATGQMRIEYKDFSGGDYGNTDPQKAPPNSFHARNLIVTADGCLVPRPGWKDRSPTGMPNGKVVGFTPTSTPNRDMMVIVANKVYTYDLSNTGAGLTEIGTLDTTPTLALYPKRGTAEYYITIKGDKSYLLDPVTNTINPLDGSPGGTEIEVYEYRLMVAGADQLYRVQFSEVGNFESWPAPNFFDTRDKWQITSMREQNNHLAILKSRGSYVLTGVPGTTNALLRRVNRGLGPLHPGQADIDENDRIHLIQAFQQAPSSFDGVNIVKSAYLKELDTARDGDTPALPLVLGVAETLGDNTPSAVMVVQGGSSNLMLLNHNGVWTRHHVETNVTGMVHGGYTGDFYITDGGGASTPGKIMSIQFDLNRPATTSDTLVNIGDASSTPLDAWVQFPQHWVGQSRRTMAGTEIQVREVIVDFDKYRTGSSATNHFVIGVNVLGRKGNVGDASSNNFTWDEVGTAAGSSVGSFKRERVIHGYKSAKGAGFQVSLTAIRGVKIRQVVVIYDIFDDLPRA